jgi:signal transduction histidine kinase
VTPGTATGRAAGASSAEDRRGWGWPCRWIVRADRQRLNQLLLNLTSNAVKYNHHAGSIRIACSPTGGGRVGIVVRDTGPGIPADRWSPGSWT